MGEDVYVGIDVSKTELVVAVRPSGESFASSGTRVLWTATMRLPVARSICLNRQLSRRWAGHRRRWSPRLVVLRYLAQPPPC
jgi:hypothetical protein